MKKIVLTALLLSCFFIPSKTHTFPVSEAVGTGIGLVIATFVIGMLNEANSLMAPFAERFNTVQRIEQAKLEKELEPLIKEMAELSAKAKDLKDADAKKEKQRCNGSFDQKSTN